MLLILLKMLPACFQEDVKGFPMPVTVSPIQTAEHTQLSVQRSAHYTCNSLILSLAGWGRVIIIIIIISALIIHS